MKTVRSLATLILSCSLLSCFPGLPVWTAGEVPFVPTPPEVVDRMLELAEMKAGDVLYDVGSGDGRIVIRAAKKYGTRGVGIEIDGELVDRARSQAKIEAVDHLVEFREQDALTADISEATVVTLYMLPEFNAKLRPKLEKLKPGARIVSHDFGIEGWPPAKAEKAGGGTLYHTHTIYLWKLP
jgi:SAM-dependent methyltransferase